MTEKTFESKYQKVYLCIVGLILVIFIGIIDNLTGYELSLSLFYLIPIFLISWKVGRQAGVPAAILSAFTWTAADLLAGKPYQYVFVPYWNFIIRASLFIIIAWLLAELSARLKKELKFARKDFVTQIANWQFFSEIAERELAKSRRYNRPLGVAYIDIDNFKVVNDSLGHQVGNVVLQSTAKVIENNIRSIDLVARLGGDEFSILLPETGYESGQIIIDRIKKSLLSNAEKNNWPITYSIGVAVFIQLPNSVDEMVKRADNLMYEAKRSGKNSVKYEEIKEKVNVKGHPSS